MAVIKYSGLVDQLRGKLNGTVFSKFHAGFNTYKKGQPSRWGSADQQRQRLGFSTAAAYWKTATPQFRQRFADKSAHYTVKNRFGEAVHIPAFQYYILISRLKQITGLDFRIEPTTDTPTLTQFTMHPGTSLTITATDQGYIMSGVIRLVTTTTNPAAVSAQLYVSSAVPETEATTRRTHYYVQRQGVPGSQPIGANVYVTLPGTVLPPSFTPFGGNQLELKLIVWTTGSAAYSVPVYFRTGFTYVPPAPPEWVLSWVFPSYEVRYTELVLIGGVWQPGGTGSWYAGAGELLPGTASQYNVEIMASPNKYSDDSPKPSEFTIPRPTYSGVMVNKVDTAPFYFTPISLANFQSFLNSNFSYQGLDEYKYQPIAIRIQRPSDGIWSTWGYSNIWLPIF